MYPIKQSTTSRPLVFRLVDSTDGCTPETGKSPTVTIAKNGGSPASPAGAVSEIGDGYYKVAGNATDTNTVGPLVLHASDTGAVLDGPHVYHVEAALVGENVTVGDYAASKSPADLVLVTPAQKLDTDSSGRVLLQPTQTGVTIPTVSSVTAIGSTERNALADAILSRSVSNVEASAGAYTVCSLVLAAFESARSGTTWTIYRTDGSTTFTTRTLATSAAATPVTGVS